MRDEPVLFDGEIADLVHDSLMACDLDGRILAWNRACELLYGWPAAQAIGEIADTLLATHGEAALDAVRAQLLAEGAWHGGLTRTTRGGATVTLDARRRLRRSPQGLPIGYFETAHDASERLRLRQMELRYQLLSANLPIALWQLETRAMTELYGALQAAGVTDLVEHAAVNPGFVEHMMRLTVVTGVNREAMRIFGATCAEDLLGGMDRFWNDRDSFLHCVNARYHGVENYSSTASLRTFDGRQIEVLFSIGFSRQIAELGVNVFCAIDITEQTRARRALAESESRYRRLFDFMPIALWELDTTPAIARFDALIESGVTDMAAYFEAHPEFVRATIDSTRVTEANEKALQLFGGTDRATLLPLMPKLWVDETSYIEASTAYRAGARTYSAETRIQQLDGRMIDALFSIAFAGPEAPEGRNLVSAIDISERKRAEAALTHSELLHRSLFQHMPIALWQINVRALMPELAALRAAGVTDLDAHIDAHPEFLAHAMRIMRVDEVNDRTVQMFGGQHREDFLGPIERFWKESPQTLRRSLVARFAGAESYAEETRVRTIDGRTIDVFYTSAFPPQLAALGITLVGAIDISDRCRAEERLQRVQADFAHAARVSMLGELAASIAHEVNQPLAAIAGSGEAAVRWLSHPEPDLEEVRALARRITADAHRAADVIHRVRAMAQRQPPQQTPVPLDEVVTEVMRFLQPELKRRGVTCDVEVPEMPPQVLGDRTQLQQLLANLAMNAAQAMEANHDGDRRLAIEISGPGDDRAQIRVSDKGPGIAPDHLPRLFDRFFSTRDSGMGMGLSICQSIVEMHGGTIAAENLRPRGARFTIALPLYDEQ